MGNYLERQKPENLKKVAKKEIALCRVIHIPYTQALKPMGKRD